MEFNLFNLVEGALSGEAVAKIASFVGEAPATTRAALGNAVPAVMCALHDKAATASGSIDLLDLLGSLRRAGLDGAAPAALPNLFDSADRVADLAQIGGRLAASLFGARQSGVLDWLANAGGIGKSVAASLLALAVPLVLDLLGREAARVGASNARTLANLVKGQASFLRSKAPAGLAQAIGVGQCGQIAASRGYIPPAATAIRGAGEGVGWARLLLPVLGFLLLILGFLAWRAQQPVQAPSAPALDAVERGD